MRLTCKYVDFKLPYLQIDNSSKLYLDDNASLLFISNSKTTSITRLQDDSSLLPGGTTEIIVGYDAFSAFSCNGNVYKITSNGMLFRLLCTPGSSPADHASVFGSSWSSSTEIFSWSKIHEKLGTIIHVAAISNGFCTIIKCHGFHSLLLYSSPDKPALESSKKLSDSETDGWNLFSFNSSKLSQLFLKQIFGDLVQVVTDIIVISSPSGTVSIFPVLVDKSALDLYPIYYDTDTLIYVTISPCQQAIILIYKSGKIVFVIYQDKIMKYKTFYLSTAIVSIQILSFGLSFCIIWSDGFSVRYTIPKSLNDFSCDEFLTKYKGVVNILSANNKILLFNINCCVYVGEIVNDIPEIESSTLDVKTAIIQVSENTDKIKEQVNMTNAYLEAIKCEGMDSSLMVLTVVEEKLYLENMSSFSFSKEFWKLSVKGHGRVANIVETYNLNSDFGCSNKIFFNIHKLIENECFSFTVIFIGRTFRNQRLLRLPIGTVSI